MILSLFSRNREEEDSPMSAMMTHVKSEDDEWSDETFTLKNEKRALPRPHVRKKKKLKQSGGPRPRLNMALWLSTVMVKVSKA
jgi:hypothetical protein